MNNILPLLKIAIAFIPVYLLLLLNRKNNLKQIYRSRQFPMPLVALIYAIVVIVLMKKFIDWACWVLAFVATLLDMLSKYAPVAGQFGQKLMDVATAKIVTVVMVVINIIAIAAFIIIKRILISIFKGVFKPGNGLYDHVSELFYESDEDGNYYVAESSVQARKFLGALYKAAVVISFLVFFVSVYLYGQKLLQIPSIPVLGIIIIGEMYFYLDGITKKEATGEISGESDGARGKYNYRAVRKVLRELFGDKLADEDTTIHTDVLNPVTAEDLIDNYQLDDSRDVETYGKYMSEYRRAGHTIDPNYLASGLDLLNGKSILFNNPFYYDLIPYAFYAMNHRLLQHKKVLIILGRHGIENDVERWCTIGLRSISNVEGLWKAGVLTEKAQDLDVGIITRSNVQNLELHRVNAEFLSKVEYVVLIEPSKLVTTAQIGINSLIRFCRSGEGKKITFCSTDKNCDGLVDALSHVLLTSISMVSATEAHTGFCSYMCWTTDDEYWQHRILPNISRYLGVGTELSIVALKNQISQTKWYGGERFPVVDMHWIAKQYYSDLLSYAELPVSQETFDSVFKVSDNLWNARKEKNAYTVIEDEFNNVFEMKRVFATRTNDQAFVNIVSSQYLLCDYMTENKGIFNADPKAIPYIVADYVATKRNVLLRVCAQMVAGDVWEDTLIEELVVAGIVGEDIVKALWENLCDYYTPVANKAHNQIITYAAAGKTYDFTSKVIVKSLKYNIDNGRDEICYHIEDEAFIHTVLGDLANARYIAEEEDKNTFIGTESLGQIFQKYLPGQFFTISGKYYEMQYVTYDGRILVRRAADHITGRKSYRQVRNYVIHYAENDTLMGGEKLYNQMEVIRQYADFSVDTPAYWDLPSYQDFKHGQKIFISGIPQRHYNNKSIIKLSFHRSGEQFNDAIRYTLTSMINEVFRTLFADNQDMIVAVTYGQHEVPLTYNLDGEYEDFDKEAIYIIEDNLYDLGLLAAVERNLTRIFQIISDYLNWNEESIQNSVVESETPPVDFTLNNEEVAEEEKEFLENQEAEKEKSKGVFGKAKGLFKKKEEKTEEKSEEKPEEQSDKESEGKEEKKPEESDEKAKDNAADKSNNDETDKPIDDAADKLSDDAADDLQNESEGKADDKPKQTEKESGQKPESGEEVKTDE